MAAMMAFCVLERTLIRAQLQLVETARDRPRARDVDHLVVERAAVVHHDQVAGLHLSSVVLVVPDVDVGPGADDGRIAVALHAVLEKVIGRLRFELVLEPPGRVISIALRIASALRRPVEREDFDLARRLDHAQLVDGRRDVLEFDGGEVLPQHLDAPGIVAGAGAQRVAHPARQPHACSPRLSSTSSAPTGACRAVGRRRRRADAPGTRQAR
jgi:hypothetical protein